MNQRWKRISVTFGAATAFAFATVLAFAAVVAGLAAALPFATVFALASVLAQISARRVGAGTFVLRVGVERRAARHQAGDGRGDEECFLCSGHNFRLLIILRCGRIDRAFPTLRRLESTTGDLFQKIFEKFQNRPLLLR